MNDLNVPPPSAISKPVPTESQAILADARQRTASRKARSAETLQQHRVSRTQQKAHSRALVEDAGRRSFERFVQSRHDRQVEAGRDAESHHYNRLEPLHRPAERRVA